MAKRGPDLIVVGSGIAGLYVALRAREEGLDPWVLTKSRLTESNTRHAQGGIAAAIGPGDSPKLHFQDTVKAGAGIVDREAAWALAQEAPQRIADLARWGVPFDTVEGSIALGREAAHSRDRILHAGGDATGLHIEETLQERATEAGIEVREHTHLLARTAPAKDGMTLLVRSPSGEEELRAPAAVLASGGAGHLYHESSNPAGATGEGVAIAARAGALVCDMEFIQFHPTVFFREGAPRFLLTEALRGEGAVLRNLAGERFMPRYHPSAELAPRDVVSRAIAFELERSGERSVLLDATAIPRQRLLQRFPTVGHFLERQGLDLSRDAIPVAPAAHFMVGGVATNLFGETSLRGLYACGEVASTGLHGANRLASNSLMEGIVFGERIVRALKVRTPWKGPVPPAREVLLRTVPRHDLPLVPGGPLTRNGLGKLLWEKVGILREPYRLHEAVARIGQDWSLAEHARQERTGEGPDISDLLLTGLLIARGALAREESRGGHYRTDFPRPRAAWRSHLGMRVRVAS
ncbi:MAG: L-aspartate oxidase [Euryarchaeota archaeon]|nr:L-aspartate oxidase [Euryarchaeota archaeon]MDE1836142.1 L-aspartate oxidase [Euryarchaeota archaeon]MDE1879432.1 L-aspartate oxidase [Euryarchaeota archaeon]MDE2044120.1 L-aspartate oxidase [Thermoplasmata archaeon]